MIERPLPYVVDTNVILRDVLRFARERHTALSLATQVGAVKAFAAIHVMDEVAEHLPELAKRQQVTNATEAWKTYSKNISFVELPTEPIFDRRVAQVQREDEDGLPTAILVATLAPCIALSEDRHLTDAGLASPEWLKLALSSRDIAYALAIRELGGVGLAGTGLGVAGMAKLIAKAAGSRLGQVGLAVAAVTALAGLERSHRAGWKGPRKAGDLAGQAVAAYFNEALVSDRRRALAEGLINQALVPPREPTTGEQIVRVLALGGEPMTATELARTLVANESPLPRETLTRVRHELSRSPIVRQTTPHRWELLTWEVV
jgi:predicted nucleic acid-binding protein